MKILKIEKEKKNVFLKGSIETTYEQGEQINKRLRTQLCPVCKVPIGDMPGTRDAVCHNCGYKDPCCE